MSGIDFLIQMKEIANKPCHVVMYTAHKDYMLTSFRNNAFDYLVKPLDEKELETVLSRINKKEDISSLEVIQQNETNEKNGNEEKLLFYTNGRFSLGALQRHRPIPIQS